MKICHVRFICIVAIVYLLAIAFCSCTEKLSGAYENELLFWKEQSRAHKILNDAIAAQTHVVLSSGHC